MSTQFMADKLAEAELRAEAAEALLWEIAGYINAHASDATHEGMRWAQTKIEALLPERRSRDE